MTKKDIREKIIKKRLLLKNSTVKEKTTKAFGNFLAANLPLGANILLYLPIKKEVGTVDFFDFYLREGANIFLPKYEDGSWGIAKFTGYDDLENGPFGTLQPKANLAIRDKIDLAIVPGVAFCRSGIRIGFGKGIYDMILPKLKAFIVGLCYDFQIVDDVEKEEHDVLVDIVISESEILKIT